MLYIIKIIFLSQNCCSRNITELREAEYRCSRSLISAAGRCDTLESAVQKIDAGHMAGSHGDYRESPVGIVEQPTSDHGVLTSQVHDH